MFGVYLTRGDIEGTRAISCVKRSKYQPVHGDEGKFEAAIDGLIKKVTGIETNEDFAENLRQKEPERGYKWSSSVIDENTILVSFTDRDGWGHRWEVTDGKNVKYVNDNEYLRFKYGATREDTEPNAGFIISDITIDTLRVGSDPYPWDNGKGIFYEMRGTMKNNTGKALIKANISGTLKLVFKDKTVRAEGSYKTAYRNRNGLGKKVSERSPWENGDDLDFKIRTDPEDIAPIYLQYMTERVVFDFHMEAADPVGFAYDKNIVEYDLMGHWVRLKERELNNQ